MTKCNNCGKDIYSCKCDWPQPCAEPSKFALPEYLVFLILGHIKELRVVAPDHVLVKAVACALNRDTLREQTELFPLSIYQVQAD